MGIDTVRKGASIPKLIEIIFQVLFFLIVLTGIISTVADVPGFFKQAETSQEVQKLLDDVETRVCGRTAHSGMLPPPDSPLQRYDFSKVENIDSTGEKLRVLMKGSDNANEVGFECENLNRVVLCKNEEGRQVAVDCAEGTGENIPPGRYSFDYFYDGEDTLYLMVHKEVEDEGPFLYYLSGGTVTNELRALSLSEEKIYIPKNNFEGVATAESYSGSSMSFSGDLDMDGRSDDIVIGNRTNLFRYDMSDFSSESIRYNNPIWVYDIGGIGNIREGEVETSKGQACEPGWNTEENRIALARILWVETRGPEISRNARVAVAYTVLRRLKNQNDDVIVKEEGVITGYGHGEEGEKDTFYGSGNDERWDNIGSNKYGQFLDIAEGVLKCEEPDVSKGATHYYSPKSMPNVEGTNYESVYDLDGSLEEADEKFDILPETCKPGDVTVEEVTEKIGSVRNYIPQWSNENFRDSKDGCTADVLDYVSVEGVDQWNFKFYNNPDIPDYTFYSRDFGEFGGNEIVFANGSFLDEKRDLCVYNYLDTPTLECISDNSACYVEEVGDVGSPRDETRVYFTDDTKLFWWNGKGGSSNIEERCSGKSENTGKVKLREECGAEEFEYNVVDVGSFESLGEDVGEDDLVITVRKGEKTSRSSNTAVGYVDFNSECSEPVFKKVFSYSTITSIGEVFDSKIPFIAGNGFDIYYYDMDEEETVELGYVDKPRQLGSFSEIIGG